MKRRISAIASSNSRGGLSSSAQTSNPYERIQNLKRYKLSLSRFKRRLPDSASAPSSPSEVHSDALIRLEPPPARPFTEPSVEVLYLSPDRNTLILNKLYDLRIDGQEDNPDTATLAKLVEGQFPRLLEQDFFVADQRASDEPSGHKVGPLRPVGQRPTRKVRFANRLDYATSGVICVGLTRRATGRMGSCFSNRTVKKQYLAVVFGWVGADSASDAAVDVCDDKAEEPEFLVESFIGPDLDDPFGFRMRNYESLEEYDGLELASGDAAANAAKKKIKKNKPRAAKTGVRVISRGRYARRNRKVVRKRKKKKGMVEITDEPVAAEEAEGEGEMIEEEAEEGEEPIKVTKVLLTLYTGRRHQLRLHMLKIGHPILGDCAYARDGLTKRMCLHSFRTFMPCLPSDPKTQHLGAGGRWIQTEDPFAEFCVF